MTLPEPTRGRLWNAWAGNFLLADGIFALLIGFAFGIWAWPFGGWESIAGAIGPNWAALFSTLVTLFGALFGFTMTAASVVSSLVTDERLDDLVIRKHYDEIWDSFLHSTASLGAGLAVALMGLILTRESATNVPILTVLLFLGVLSAFRLIRVVWILDKLPRLHAALVKKRKERTPDPAQRGPDGRC